MNTRTVYTISLTHEATGEQSTMPGYFTILADAQDALWELGREFVAYHARIVREVISSEDEQDA